MGNQQKYDRGDIRRLNAVSVLHQLRVKGSLSRANIALELGLTRATVSNIVADLINVSMVNETEYDASRAGRPGLLLNLNPSYGSMIAIDINIDSIRLLLTDFNQRVIAREEKAFTANSMAEVTLEVAASMVQKAIDLGEKEGLRCLGLCVAWAGLVDREEGKLAFGPTTGWQHVPLKSRWEARFKLPVYVENEAHAGAIGAHHFGERPGVRNLIYLSLGVGLAAGVFVDGILLRGKQGFAGQVGHTAFTKDGVACSCGKKGCWVTEIGAAAVLRKLDAAGVKLPHKVGNGVDWMGTVIAKAEAGDTVVQSVLASVGEQVGVGIANLVQTFNPSVVLVGGRMADLMQHVEPSIRQAIWNNTLSYMTEPLKIAIGSASEDVLRGGIATVFDAIMKNPFSPK